MADNRDFKNYDLEKEILINKKDLIELGFVDDDPYLHLKVNEDISLQFHCYEHDDDFITMCVSNDDFDDALHYELKHIKTISQVKSLYYILTNKKLNTMNTSTKETENLAENGNKSKPLLSTVVLSPTEFYEKQFPDDANLLKGLQNKPFFSLTAMVQFTELYANYLRSVQL